MKKLTGNGMWESSRMMLPEHKEAILKQREEEGYMSTLTKPKKSKPQRPSRDEYELEELANQLTEAKEEGREVVLIVWKLEEPVRGRITKLDANTKLVHVERYGEVRKVPFLDILKVGNPEW